MQTRSDNFQKRVSIERKVLQLINSGRSCTVPLAGLTKPAIQRWAKQTGAQAQHRELLPLLAEISARLSVEADKSKQVFDSKPVSSSLAKLVNEIERLLE